MAQKILFSALAELHSMYYRRNLPHWHPENSEFFVTWRLFGSMPKKTPDVLFRDYDAALDRATGPRWLADPRVAGIFRDAVRYGAASGRYELHAWVIMPNHVHLLFSPKIPLSRVMQWLKRVTAVRANRVLGLTGNFWQVESYDHWIRTDKEFNSTIRYIESNPVTAGLVESDDEWPWSSASGAENKIFCATD